MFIINKEIGKYFTFQQAKKKPIYSWFYYKEGFSPEIVDYCLSLAKEKEKPRILDSFAGVGTTLLRAKERGIESFGVDISPLAYFISKVKTVNYEEKEIGELEEGINTLSKAWRKEEPKPIYFELFPLERAFPSYNLNFLLKMREAIKNSSFSEKARAFFLLALLSILPMTSFVVKDGAVLKINKRKRVAKAKELFKRKAKRMIKEIKAFEKRVGVEPKLKLEDAKTFDKEIESFSPNIVITSPPYVNAVDYTKVYGIELAFLGVTEREVKEIRGRMISSSLFKKIKPNKIKSSYWQKYSIPIVASYFEEMEGVIDNYSKYIEKGDVFIVVSNAVINGEEIEVDRELSHILQEKGFNTKIIVGLIRKTRINGKMFKARESIVWGRK